MNIAISGASGFIGTSVQYKLLKGNVEFQVLRRNDSDAKWRNILKEADVVINLAGAPVIQRWTKKNRESIVESRVNTTRRIVQILNDLPSDIHPGLLISASAIGIYPDCGEEVHAEDSKQTGDTFLSEVVMLWEKEAIKLDQEKVRLVIPRIGVVLGKDGGLLKKTLPLFKFGLGGKIGSGKQTLSFIHIDDLISALQFFVHNESTTGVYNLVAPNMTTNQEFTRILGKLLRRATLFVVPAFVLKIIYGEAARIMINGEKVVPERLLQEGFNFQYPRIEQALKSVLSKND